jgi:hypothetical protein
MKRGIANLLVFTLLLTGCASTGTPQGGAQSRPRNVKEWMSGQSRAKRGAIAGALLGAVTGAAIATVRGKNPWEGAAVGAVGGAIVGFAIGKGQDRIYANRDDAIRTAGYDSSQGYLARVEEIKFEPAQPKPGQTASLYVRYLVVGPNPNEDIKIRMFRGLKYGDDYIVGVGPNEFVVPRGGGIVESTMPVTLPAKVPQGTYGLEALLEDPAGRFSQVVRTSSLYLVG